MRILLIAHSSLPFTFAGTEVYSFILARELSRKHEVTIFCRIHDSKQSEYALNQIVYKGQKIYTVNNTFSKCRGFNETYSNKRIDAVFEMVLKEVNPDVIHIQHLLFLSLGLIGVAKKNNIPIVFTSHDYWLICHKGQLVRKGNILCDTFDPHLCTECLAAQLTLNPFSAYMYRFLRQWASFFLLRFCRDIYLATVKLISRSARNEELKLQDRRENMLIAVAGIDSFIAPSEFMRQKLIEFGIPKEKLFFCQYGIATKRYQGVRKEKAKTLRFSFIGTLLPTKGIDLLVQAFKDVKDNNVSLNIYGRQTLYAGYEGFYRSLLRCIGRDPRIRLMGEVENDKIEEVYAHTDVLVVPSVWYENTPLVILEALASQTPVVASRIGGIPELVHHGVNGLLFSPNDCKDLSGKLNLLSCDPVLLERLRQGAHALKDIKENALEMEEIYRKLLNNKFKLLTNQ